MRFSRTVLTLFMFIGSIIAPAGAATYVLEETIDLELLDLSRFVNWRQPLTTSVGPVFDDDTLDITVNFANNQSLRIDQGGSFSMRVGFAFGGNTTEIFPSNVSAELFDVVTNGSFTNGVDIGSETGGTSEGRSFLASDLGIEAPGSFLQFSGMRMVFDIALLDDAPNLFFRNLDFTTFNASLVETSVIPIPAAAWLFASGLLVLMGVSRRGQSA